MGPAVSSPPPPLPSRARGRRPHDGGFLPTSSPPLSPLGLSACRQSNISNPQTSCCHSRCTHPLQNFALLVMTKPLDCSLWYCAACSEGGELLCCDGCPAAYHTKCLDHQQEPNPHSEWLCGDCRAVRCMCCCCCMDHSRHGTQTTDQPGACAQLAHAQHTHTPAPSAALFAVLSGWQDAPLVSTRPPEACGAPAGSSCAQRPLPSTPTRQQRQRALRGGCCWQLRWWQGERWAGCQPQQQQQRPRAAAGGPHASLHGTPCFCPL